MSDLNVVVAVISAPMEMADASPSYNGAQGGILIIAMIHQKTVRVMGIDVAIITPEIMYGTGAILQTVHPVQAGVLAEGSCC